ncbi:MAG: hypothetical protein ACXWBP_03910 [Limisphaerales bacterium]
MSDTKTFVKAAAEKAHFALGLISGFGVIIEAVRAVAHWDGWKSLKHFVLGLDWFMAVAIIYTVIAFLVGGLLTTILASTVFRSSDPKRNTFMVQAGTPVMIIAAVVGIIVAIYHRAGPVIHNPEDIVGVILFRVIGFGAIAAMLVLLGYAWIRIRTDTWPGR